MLQKEVIFCEFFETNLLNRTQSTYDVINKASKLIGRSEHANCGSCAKNEYIELRNIYNSMLTAYEKYKSEIVIPVVEPLPDVYTRYEAVELIEDGTGEIKKFHKKKKE